MDLDGDGYITKKNFINMLKDLNYFVLQSDKYELKKLFYKKYLSFREFIYMMQYLHYIVINNNNLNIKLLVDKFFYLNPEKNFNFKMKLPSLTPKYESMNTINKSLKTNIKNFNFKMKPPSLTPKYESMNTINKSLKTNIKNFYKNLNS